MKKFLSNFEAGLGSLVLVIMLGLAFINVIFRYFLSASISYTEEITCALFVLLCVLGTSIAAKDRGHLGLSLITEHLSERTQTIFSLVANVLGVLFSLILVYTGVGMAYSEYKMNQISITLQWPEWIYGSFLPIGALFMSVRFAQVAHSDLKHLLAMKKEG